MSLIYKKSRRKGFIAGRDNQNGPVRFWYVPFNNRTRHMYLEDMKAIRTAHENPSDAAIEAEKLSCQVMAAMLTDWDITYPTEAGPELAGKKADITPELLMEHLEPYVLGRMSNIIGGFGANDPDPKDRPDQQLDSAKKSTMPTSTFLDHVRKEHETELKNS